MGMSMAVDTLPVQLKEQGEGEKRRGEREGGRE